MSNKKHKLKAKGMPTLLYIFLEPFKVIDGNNAGNMLLKGKKFGVGDGMMFYVDTFGKTTFLM